MIAGLKSPRCYKDETSFLSIKEKKIILTVCGICYEIIYERDICKFKQKIK